MKLKGIFLLILLTGPVLNAERVQTEFLSSVSEANRIVIRTGGLCHRIPEREQVIYESAKREDVNSVIQMIKLEDPRPPEPVEGDLEMLYMNCMCCGDFTLEFYEDSNMVIAASFHHGTLLRSKEFNGGMDADLETNSASRLNTFIRSKIDIR